MKLTVTKNQMELYLEGLKSLQKKLQSQKMTTRKGFQLMSIEQEIERLTILLNEGSFGE